MITEVIHKLKKSGLSHYALPWFLLLGSENSGKSILLKNSGLDFSEEYEFSEHIKFLFSSQAVIIKIAIAPLTASVTAELIAILNFIKKYRPKKPINSLIWLLKLPEEIQLTQIKPMREFLAKITELLGYVFPVVLFFNYLDTLAGFEDFFKNIPHDKQFFELHEKTAELLWPMAFELTQKTPDIQSKFNILNFPGQFLNLYQNLKLFLDNLRKSSPYQELPSWGPVFLTAREKFVSGAFQKLLKPDYLQGNTTKIYKIRRYCRWVYWLSVVSAVIIILTTLIITHHITANNINHIQQGVILGQKLASSDNPEDYNNLAQYLSKNSPIELADLLAKIFVHNADRQLIPQLVINTGHNLAKLQDHWALATLEEENQLRGLYLYQLKFYQWANHVDQRYAEFYEPEQEYIHFYFTHSQKSWPIQGELIQLAQQQLGELTSLKNLYRGFKYWGEKVPENRFYTEQGFEKLALPEIKRLAKTEDQKNQLLTLYQTDYKTAWINYLQNIKAKPEDKYTPRKIQKILTTARKNIFFENLNLDDYYKKLTENLDDQKYLDNLAKTANTAVKNISDIKIQSAIQNVLYLPLRVHYLGLLNKKLENSEFQWRTQIIAPYSPKITLKYPFLASAAEEVSPDEFNYFFDRNQGVLASFINTNLLPYFSSNWLDIKANFTTGFIKLYGQIKYMTNNFTFEIYPEPTLGLKEIRLITNNQNYKYRNDPQEWQIMHWQLNPNEPETVLQIITVNGNMGSIEATGPWGLFKLLEKSDLSRVNAGLFKAHWRIRVDDGRYYGVNLLFKSPKENNLLNILLFEKVKLPRELFIV